MSDMPPNDPTGIFSVRGKVVQAVHSPLGFFVLALLIVEAFLWGAGTSFGLSEKWRIAALAIGVLLFLIVFGAVFWLVVNKPENLVFSEESHVQYAAMRMFGTESRRITGRDLSALPTQAAPNHTVGQLPNPESEN
jgi:hypothetical protein